MGGFSNTRAWVFDLDNTLYPASCDLFAQIDDRMTGYIARLLAVDRDEARRLQKEHYRLHGTTLNGLMKLHGVEPEDYLAYVHDIDLSTVQPDPTLAEALARLPGRRFVFTNGCRHHAERVLARLELSHLFDEIWDIRTIEYRPKPDAHAYRTALARSGVPAAQGAMFDDIARNLVEAHALGWTTVWLRNGSDWSRQGPSHPIAEPHHIHYETEDLAQFLHAIRL
ncbi:MAG TPA: pyrimidine 5'-nucleotidase [Rhizomicrobium sp.]|jgi:putative hydrolase of the HAD superfamily|nr:pyrimidine 5'-nucleotidase [Rhizomicrobium sp.]